MKKRVILLAGVIVLQRLLELRLAERNRRRVLAQGAHEAGAGHYPLFFLLHTGWLLAWLIEAWPRRSPGWGWPLWLSLFATAQGLRYWAITSLGPFWNTRILVVPNAPRVRQGPYRWLRHPNYLAVAVELAAVPLIFGAWLTALTASLLNATLLLGVRIPAEEAALKRLVA